MALTKEVAVRTIHKMLEPEQEPVAWGMSVKGPEPDWKAEYLKTVDLHCETLDKLREALAQSEQHRFFCPRCGKRLGLHTVHTCTPPRTFDDYGNKIV